MGNVVKWAQMKGSKYSGPQVRGICSYSIPGHPTGFDIIVGATARPEGGAYDTVVMYDGTAVTYGLLQWTFTSGRLHKLLLATAQALTAKGGPFDPDWTVFGMGLKKIADLRVNYEDSGLYFGEKKVTDFFKLRDVCTPPGGTVPRKGRNWEKAKKIALLFSKLGENGLAQQVQLDFFREELRRECMLQRPKLGKLRIADYLYPNGWDDDPNCVTPCLTAARALFWGMWQNAPRKAEELLDKAARGYFLPLQNLDHLRRLAKMYAYTNFARWGVEKAKKAEKPYTSRYQKVAEEINKAMQQVIVPEYWK